MIILIYNGNHDYGVRYVLLILTIIHIITTMANNHANTNYNNKQ